nr:DNA mismatch repair endonuclease MutL [Desulfobacteraceae bacterium]
MSRIKILPEQVANQIAAGEVVERPASVVKEFVENAIDAGARQLRIEVEGAGTRLLRVVDDGEGMDQDDVLLCLERHATSKLASREQLAAITTLGFRGEAVPSIASVSRLTITSRPAGSALGTRIEVHYGKVAKVHDMGCSQGTVMEVRDLFGNVPARRKFLKSPQTELAHIDEVVRSYALARPALGVTFAVDGRDVLDLPAGADSLEQRLTRLTGSRSQGPFIPVHAQDQGLDLTGFLLPPEEGTGSSRLSLFVNGRAVRDRLLTHAVAEGLRHFLMKGRRPAGALFLGLPPAEVDVNVHPAKHEVRFRQGARIHQLVAAAVAGAMAAHQERLKESLFVMPPSRGRGEAEAPSPPRPPEPSQAAFPALQVREPAPVTARSWAPPAGTGESRSARPAPIRFPHPQPPPPKPEPLPGAARNVETGAARPPVPAGEPAPSGLRLIGPFDDSYLLCESDAGLVVIDQHAAHERLLFEQLRRQFDERQTASQALLFPKMISLGPEEIELLAKHGEEIARLGIEVGELGAGSYVLRALPALLAHLPAEEVLGDVLDRYRGCDLEGQRSASGRLDAVLATM